MFEHVRKVWVFKSDQQWPQWTQTGQLAFYMWVPLLCRRRNGQVGEAKAWADRQWCLCDSQSSGMDFPLDMHALEHYNTCCLLIIKYQHFCQSVASQFPRDRKQTFPLKLFLLISIPDHLRNSNLSYLLSNTARGNVRLLLWRSQKVIWVHIGDEQYKYMNTFFFRFTFISVTVYLGTLRGDFCFIFFYGHHRFHKMSVFP